jgi:hypothetical protein
MALAITTICWKHHGDVERQFRRRRQRQRLAVEQHLARDQLAYAGERLVSVDFPAPFSPMMA